MIDFIVIHANVIGLFALILSIVSIIFNSYWAARLRHEDSFAKHIAFLAFSICIFFAVLGSLLLLATD